MGSMMMKAIARKKTELIENIPKNFFDLSAKDIDGNMIKFCSYKLSDSNKDGKKAFLVVNVACDWGLTKNNYKELVELDDKFRDSGLHIMGFPCNQFFAQEKRPESEIKEYVQEAFDVKFQLYSKVEVNGENSHPIYKFLRKNSKLDSGEKGIKEIPWNFSKFLVNRNGNVIEFYPPTVSPKKISSKIEELLKN